MEGGVAGTWNCRFRQRQTTLNSPGPLSCVSASVSSVFVWVSTPLATGVCLAPHQTRSSQHTWYPPLAPNLHVIAKGDIRTFLEDHEGINHRTSYSFAVACLQLVEYLHVHICICIYIQLTTHSTVGPSTLIQHSASKNWSTGTQLRNRSGSTWSIDWPIGVLSYYI